MTSLAQHITRLRNSTFFSETLSHFKNYLSTRIATQAISFISIPVLTRLLSPEEYGTYNVFLSYTGLFSVLLTLNLSSAVGRYFYENKPDFRSFLGTVIIVNTIQLVVSTVAFLFILDRLSSWFSLPPLVIMIMPVVILIVLVDNLFQQLFQGLKESRKIAVVTIWRTYLTFGVGVVIVLLLAGNRYLGLIWGQIIIGLVVSVYLLHQMRPHISWKLETGHLRYIFSYSIPLIPYTLSGIILDQFDRIMINSYSGSASAGLYSFAYNIGMLLNVFSSALYQAWMPNFFEYMNKKDFSSLNVNAERMFRIILLAAVLLIYFGQDIGQMLAGRNYYESLHIVPVIVLGYVFYAIFPLYAWSMGYGYRTLWVSFIVLAAGIVNILLNRILIPHYGYEAAAYATLASFILMALMAWVTCRYILNLYTTPPSAILRPLAVLMLFTVAAALTQLFIKGPVIVFFIKILLAIGSAYALLGKYLRPPTVEQ
jgi:O-antigen/teichoic acid export membrane protein